MNLVLGTVAKQLDVAGLAVGIVAVLLECAFVEQFETEGTHTGWKGWSVRAWGEGENVCIWKG